MAAERSFYLAGGTALALRLGHRRSVDLDWFTAAPVPDPLRLASDLKAAGLAFAVERTERGTLHGTLSGVRVSFIEYQYPPLRPPTTGSWPGAPAGLASLPDIACMKLAAVAQRGSKKDFLDVYALGRRIPLRRMLGLYRRKYSVGDIGHLLYALTYFDDADRERTPFMVAKWTWPRVKDAIRRWVIEVAR